MNRDKALLAYMWGLAAVTYVASVVVAFHVGMWWQPELPPVVVVKEVVKPVTVHDVQTDRVIVKVPVYLEREPTPHKAQCVVTQ